MIHLVALSDRANKKARQEQITAKRQHNYRERRKTLDRMKGMS